jgi:hypothetical protein
VSAVTVTRPAPAGGGTSGKAPGPDAFHARLLQQALKPLAEGERLLVLDLGEPHAETVGFFSGFRVRLSIASALSELPALDPTRDESDLRSDIEAVLPERLVRGAQVVMAWDVLSYLKPSVIRALMSYLAELLPRGARVHGFIAYGVKDLPESPRALAVLPDGWLRRLPAPAGATREAKGCPTGELQRLMPDFRVEKAILLGDGMQECLFRL